jgi:hypothetical protein
VSQAAGWYRDPFMRDHERYWDGKVWTQGSRLAGADADAEQPAVPSSPDPALGALSADVSNPGPTYAPLGAPVPPPVAAPAVPLAAGGPPAAVLQEGRRNGHRRFAVLAVGAAALVLVAGGIVAALVLGQSGNASAEEAVATAATQTLNAQSADMSMSMDMSFLGVHETITGTGAFDYPNHIGTMTMTIPVGGTQHSEQAIYDGTTIYINIGDLAPGLPSGKQWISEDISKIESAGPALNAGGLDNGTFGDPAAMLQQLTSVGGTVTSLGPTTYDGTPVTEYTATLPASVLQGEIGQLPASLQKDMSRVHIPDIKMDVYITSNNLLKAMHMPMSFSVDGQSISMDMTMSFSNYGTPVTVTPPPASEVEPLGQFPGDLGSGDTGSTGNTGDSENSGNTGAIF